MTFEYNGTEIFYRVAGGGKPCFLLHGWGCDGQIFSSIISKIPDRKFIIIDFPPFGKSGQNIEEWNIFTYANMVASLSEHLAISSFDVVGHSFGGRVAILLGALFSDRVSSLALVDSAGLKPKRPLKYYFKVSKYKIFKYFGIKTKLAGSTDYQNMPPQLKKVFVQIVNTYLDDYCPSISAPTLIVYGDKDKDTPIYMANRLKKYICGSKVVLLKDAGHFCFLDNPLLFCKIITEFWEGL